MATAGGHPDLLDHQVDHLADGLDALEVVALEAHAELVLDDLRQLDEVERIHVERLELGLALDLARLGADLGEAVEDHLLHLLGFNLGCHLSFLSLLCRWVRR